MTPKTSSALMFPAAVSVAVTIAMLRPSLFGQYFGYDLKNLIVPLIQIIMFGMGAKLSAADFIRVFVMPWPVVIGVGLHYLVMPLVGFAIATIFKFPPEIAAGVILVGSVSSGAASNLIAYLSGANVALAVTITACSTLVSPVMTPFLMQKLAGRFIPIDFWKMFLDILNLILVPIVAGLIANRILYGKTTKLGVIGIAALFCGIALGVSSLKNFCVLQPGI
jgi:BASS family bile acid:Na+ symporter